MVSLIHRILDFFYPLFQKFFDKQTYYYAACGGSNMVLSWILFFVFFNLILQKKVVYIDVFNQFGFTTIALSAYTISAFLCFLISFSLGFLLMKYVVFTSSKLKGRIQLFRYGLSAVISSFLSWVLLKIQIDLLSIYPSIANVIATLTIVVVSYLIQRNFTFK